MTQKMTKELLTAIQEIKAKPGQRLLVVSDIHGHRSRLVRLLDKMNYGGNDILIIVGDLIEKGPESLGTVQYVMEFCGRRPVYVSMGNVEQYRLHLLWKLLEAEEADHASRQAFDGYLHWAEQYWKSSLFQEMLGQLGVSVSQVTPENVAEHMSAVMDHFKKEIGFLWSRPTILTAGKYLFVHGGIPTEELASLEGTDPVPYLKNDNFLSQGYSFQEHTLVVGHWPTGLYRSEEENLSPLFDRERRILCIDGGCGLKYAGQLNGIMIPDCNADIEEIAWTYCDDFPPVRATTPQKPRKAGLHVQYFDSAVEILGEDAVSGAEGAQSGKTDTPVGEDVPDGTKGFEKMVLVRQLSSGKEFKAPLAWIKRWDDGRLHCSDYCDSELEVKQGEELSVILRTEKDGCYVKNSRGEIGWYRGSVT